MNIIDGNLKEILGALGSFILFILTLLFKNKILEFVKSIKDKNKEEETSGLPPKSRHFFDVEEKNYRVKFGNEIKVGVSSNFRNELMDRLNYCKSNSFKSLILDFNDTKLVNENVIDAVEYVTMKVITENNIQLIVTLGKRGTTLIDMYAKLQKTVEQFDVSNVKIYIYDKRVIL